MTKNLRERMLERIKPVKNKSIELKGMGVVYIRPATLDAQTVMGQLINDGVGIITAMVVAFVVDKDGNPWFSLEDAKLLGQATDSTSIGYMNKITEVINEFSMPSELAGEDGEKVIENVKNS